MDNDTQLTKDRIGDMVGALVEVLRFVMADKDNDGWRRKRKGATQRWHAFFPLVSQSAVVIPLVLEQMFWYNSDKG